MYKNKLTRSDVAIQLTLPYTSGWVWYKGLDFHFLTLQPPPPFGRLVFAFLVFSGSPLITDTKFCWVWSKGLYLHQLPCCRFRHRGNVFIPRQVRCDREAQYVQAVTHFQGIRTEENIKEILFSLLEIKQHWVLFALKLTKFWEPHLFS